MVKIKSITSFGFPKKVFKYGWHHKKISSVVLIILIVLGYFLIPKQGAPILTETISKKDVVKSVSITGDISSDKSVNLSFQIGGKLSYLGIKEGDTVEAFQTIAVLDQRSAEKNLDIALLNYSLQRNTFDTTVADNQNRTPEGALNNQMKLILQNNQYDLNKSIDSVDLQDLARQESILTTPIAGIVTRADAVTSGVNVTPATVFTITDPDSLNFKMEVNEADIGLIKPDQNINVSMDSFPDKDIKLMVNKIDFVSHKSSSGGNSFYVKSTLDKNTAYRVGMSGNADIIVAKKENVLTIPLSSLVDDSFAYVKKNNMFEKRSVKLGLQDDTRAEVISGLSEGESVAIDPSSVPPNLILKTK